MPMDDYRERAVRDAVDSALRVLRAAFPKSEVRVDLRLTVDGWQRSETREMWPDVQRIPELPRRQRFSAGFLGYAFGWLRRRDDVAVDESGALQAKTFLDRLPEEGDPPVEISVSPPPGHEMVVNADYPPAGDYPRHIDISFRPDPGRGVGR